VSIRNPFLRGHQIGWLWTLDRSNELSVPLNLLLVLFNLVPSHSFTSESTYGSIKLIITFQILIPCVRHSAYLSPGLIHLWNVTGHITRRKKQWFHRFRIAQCLPFPLSFHFPRITKAWFTRAEYLVRVVDSALEMMCVTGQEILLLQSRCAGLCVTTMSISF
jgi:hypothetical protein